MKHLNTVNYALLTAMAAVAATPTGQALEAQKAAARLDPGLIWDHVGPGGMLFEGDGAAHMDRIITEIKGVETLLKSAVDKQAEEIKKFGETSTATAKEMKELDLKWENHYKELKEVVKTMQAKAGRAGLVGADGEPLLTPGQALVQSERFKSLSRGSQFSVAVELKALSTADASAGVLMVPQRLALQERPTEPHVRDLLPVGQTSANRLLFPARLAYTNNAAMVAELGQKPESDLTFEDTSFDVRKIAHFVKVSDELLEDAPALRSYIDNILIEGVKDVEDRQLLKGDGTGQNLLGLYTAASALTRTEAGDSLFIQVRKALTVLRTRNRVATGIVLHPFQLEELELMRDDNGAFMWANLQNGAGETRLWRVPVRESTALNDGEWLVGDFLRSAMIYDRQQVKVEATNTDTNDFQFNRVTIRAEERLALVILDSLGLIKNPTA